MQTNKLTAILSGLGLSIVTITLLTTVFNLGLIVAIIIGFVAGAAVTVFLIARSRGEKPQQVAKEIIDEALNPAPDSLAVRIEEQLLQLNLQLRLKTTEDNIIQSCELLIDKLLDVVPRAISESPDSQASFDLEKLCTDYVPDLVNKFLNLSSSDQHAQTDELLKQLTNLIETADQAKQSLDQGNLNEFQVSNAFLHAKHA
ncbi:MAG: hypothetical protein QM479_03810 [Pseudomonadota bacterium]